MGESTKQPLDIKLMVAGNISNWAVLCNGRLGFSLPIHRTGRQIYLATDGKSRLCLHGEKKSRIAMMISGRRARKGCLCDCQNLEGLTSRQDTPSLEGWQSPEYYKVLVEMETAEVKLPGGRVGRHIPHTAAVHGCDLVMLPCGNIRCIHGHSESTLRNRGRVVLKTPRRVCECAIRKSSWRRIAYQNVITRATK